jgi:hypothetical protein
VLETRLGGCDEGGQKPPEIRPDTIIDLTTLMDQSELWLKTNDFGHPTTVKKPAITAAIPNREQKGVGDATVQDVNYGHDDSLHFVVDASSLGTKSSRCRLLS